MTKIEIMKCVTAELTDIWDDLPSVLKDRAMLCAAERSVPFELAAVTAICAVSAALGKGLVAQSGRSRTTRANLYLLLGVSSGIGKSEIFRDMLEPLLDYEAKLHAWWLKEAAPRARAGEELLKARISKVRSDVRKFRPCLKQFRIVQEAETNRDLCRVYLKPPCLVADDATPEALAEIMVRSHESLAMISPDARYLLKRLSKPDSKDENFLLKAFSGDFSLTSRVTRNAARLRSPCLSVLLLTQRDAYSRFIDQALKNRSGLLPRFLHTEITTGHSSAVSFDKRRAPKTRRNYAEIIGELIENFQSEEVPGIVEPTPETLSFLSKIEEAARTQGSSDESIHGEILRRRAEQCWRIALALHAADHGSQAVVNPLSVKHAKCAKRIVDRFTHLET